ncbi:MAG: phosphatase PAP2 family protein, partial [Rhodanobacteraceae bacterium]
QSPARHGTAKLFRRYVMPLEGRLWIAAAASLVFFASLGVSVSHRPASRLDFLGGSIRGHATDLAVAFTDSGRGPFLLAFSIAAVIAFAFARSSVLVPVGVIVSQTLSQGLVEAIKRVFHRLRPDNWLVGRELGYSFPSGHATTSIVFYGAWATLVAVSPAPKPLKIAVVALFSLWILGIVWSRLALSAHYLTDVVGGILFGLAWLCALWAMYVHLQIPIHVH